MKSIKAVLIWLIPITFLISGCSTWNRIFYDEPVQVQRTELILPDVDPLQLDTIKWNIITPANAQEIFDILEKNGEPQVLFGLTGQDYENASVNQAKTLMFIRQQNAIIKALKDYYNQDTKE